MVPASKSNSITSLLCSPQEEAVKSISSPAFNLPKLRFRDTRREIRWFQGGPDHGATLKPPLFTLGVSHGELRELEEVGKNSTISPSRGLQHAKYDVIHNMMISVIPVSDQRLIIETQ
jgi:hypothetical protein